MDLGEDLIENDGPDEADHASPLTPISLPKILTPRYPGSANKRLLKSHSVSKPKNTKFKVWGLDLGEDLIENDGSDEADYPSPQTPSPDPKSQPPDIQGRKTPWIIKHFIAKPGAKSLGFGKSLGPGRRSCRG